MDETDKKILEMLKDNSRIHNVEVARAVRLTEGAVRARIERLVRDGIIQRFTIETAETTGSRAIIMVKARNDTKRMMKEITTLRMAGQAYEIAGSPYDACLVVDGSDMAEIDRKIDRVRALKSVHDTSTFIVLKRW